MRLLFPLLIIFIICINQSIAQLSEKINLIIAGGPSIPVESSIGSSFTFIQLDIISDTSFSNAILGIENSASNFEKYWEPGFNLGAGLEYKFNKYLSLIAAFSYNNFVFDENKLANDFSRGFGSEFIDLPFNSTGFDVIGGTANIYTISLNAKARYPLKFATPYIAAGGGFMRVNQEQIGVNYFDEPFDNIQATVSFYDIVPENKENVFTGNAGVGLIFNLGKNFRPFVEANYLLGLTSDNNTIIYPIKFGFVFNLQ
jgi:opacity protein-like surface antigen